MRRIKWPESGSASTEFARGWLVVLACLIGNGLSVQTLCAYTAGIFIAPLEHEFSWSRTSISFAITILTFGTALASPVVGWLVDHLGERILLVFGICVIAACFFGFSVMGPSLTEFWGITALLAIFGTACSPIPLTRLLLASFDRYRGAAIGLSLVGIGLVAAIAPPIVGQIVQAHGWRAGYAAMGVVMLAALPVVIGLLSLHGMLHGKTEPRANTVTGPQLGAEDATPDVVAPPSARLISAFVFVSLGTGGIIVHYVPILVDAGMDPTTAAKMAGIIGVALIVGRAATGVILDYVFAPHLAAAIMGLSAFGFLAVGIFGGKSTLLAAPIIGLSLGSELDLIAYTISRYYKAHRFSLIFSRIYAIFLCSLGLSPLFDAQIFEWFGSYSPVFCWTASLLAVSAVLFVGLPKFPTAQAGRVVSINQKVSG
jgi:MFS family permease